MLTLLDAQAPNPRVVRLLLQEKGIEIDIRAVDLLAGENRQPEFLALNPSGQVPALLTDEGCLSEVSAICEYLEEHYPEPALIGSTAWERAEARMWFRKVDLAIVEPLTNSFRYKELSGFFAARIPVYPDAADALRSQALDGLRWLEQQWQGREFLCGERLTYADLLLFALVDFFRGMGFDYPEACAQLRAWHERLQARFG